MIKILRSIGVTSELAYIAGLASVAASIAAWATSRNMEHAQADKAERWAIFVGPWAPTFMAIGNALKVDGR